MDNFDVFYETGRHYDPTRADGSLSRGINRKNQALIPDIHKQDPSKNNKVEMLKKKGKGSTIISPVEARAILKQYNINRLDKSRPRGLGNSGVSISFKDGNFFISIGV